MINSPLTSTPNAQNKIQIVLPTLQGGRSRRRPEAPQPEQRQPDGSSAAPSSPRGTAALLGLDPASPAAAPPPQGRRRGPPQLDTLLPGFASRPNPSPRGEARKPPRGGSGSGGDGGGGGDADGGWLVGGDKDGGADQCIGAGAAGGDDDGGDWLDASATGGFLFVGEPDASHRGSEAAAAAAAAAADPLGRALGLAPRGERQGRTLLQQHIISASERAAQQQREWQQQQQQAQAELGGLLPGAPAAGADGQEGRTAAPRGSLPPRPPPAAAAAASLRVWSELAAEFSGAAAAPPNPEGTAPLGAEGGAAEAPLHPLEQQHQQQRQQQEQEQQQRQEPASQPSARKRRAPGASGGGGGGGGGGGADSSERAGRGGSGNAAGEAAGPQAAQPPQPPSPPPRPLGVRLHQNSLGRSEARALDALPLPPRLERLLRVFGALAAWQGFLARQHAAATWANSRLHARGLLPDERPSPLDVLLAAEVAPHLVAVLEADARLRAALERAHPRLGEAELGAAVAKMAATAAAAAEGADAPAEANGGNSDDDGGGEDQAAAALGFDDSGDGEPPPLLVFEFVDPGSGGGGGGAAAKGRARPREARGADGQEMQQQQQAPQEEAAATSTSGGSQQPSADAAADAAPEAARGPLRPPPPLGGKRALARRTQAFRRALAFALALVHGRFVAALRSAEEGGAAEQRQQANGGELGQQPGEQQPGVAPASSRPQRRAATRARQRVAQQLAPDGGAHPAADEAAAEGQSEPEPRSKRRKRAAGAANGSAAVAEAAAEGGPAAQSARRRSRGGGGDGGAAEAPWDAVSRGAWHPRFNAAAVTWGQLRAALAEHARWLAAELRLGEAAALAAAAAAPGSGAVRGGQGPAAPPRLVKRHERCTDTAPLAPRAFLEHLQALPWYDGQLAAARELPARPARRAAPAARLSAPTLAALASRGIVLNAAAGNSVDADNLQAADAGGGGGGRPAARSGLFSHQAAAIDALLLRRRHVAVCTATASGKSLCYNVPVLEALAADPSACALYLFPTKALAHDQLGALRGMLAAAFGPGAADLVQVCVCDEGGGCVCGVWCVGGGRWGWLCGSQLPLILLSQTHTITLTHH